MMSRWADNIVVMEYTASEMQIFKPSCLKVYIGRDFPTMK